jgi:hypothetical protein
MTSQPKIILEDDIEACDGDQLLGVFMNKLYAWADSTNAGLTKIKGTRWIGCSTKRWITERKPWGKNNKVSKHQFERMLARGRKMGVLKTCQSPSRFEKWKTVLHVRPADGYSERRTGAAQCRTDAGPMQGFCGTDAGPVQNPDQDHGTISGPKSGTVIGVPADADNAITPAFPEKSMRLSPPPEAQALSPQFRRPPSPEAMTPMQLWKVWVHACVEHHGMKLERATDKQKGQLRAMLDIVQGRDLDPFTFVTTVVADWTWLTCRVSEKTDDVQHIPAEPCLGFTRRFLDHLISVVQEEAARKVKEARRDADRKAQREKEEAKNKAALVAHARAEQAKLNAMAKQGAQFATKEAAVAAMYACIGRGDPIHTITGKSIRAFLSSWGGVDQLDDKAICAKYRRDLVKGYFDYVEAEEAGGEQQQPIPGSVVPFPKAA